MKFWLIGRIPSVPSFLFSEYREFSSLAWSANRASVELESRLLTFGCWFWIGAMLVVCWLLFLPVIGLIIFLFRAIICCFLRSLFRFLFNWVSFSPYETSSFPNGSLLIFISCICLISSEFPPRLILLLWTTSAGSKLPSVSLGCFLRALEEEALVGSSERFIYILLPRLCDGIMF